MKSKPSPKATLRSPTTREAEAIADAADRTSKRRKRVQASIEGYDAGECRIGPKHSDSRGWSAQLTDAFGTTSEDFANVTLNQTLNALPLSEDSLSRMTNVVLATVDGTRPKDEIEAMLTSQMVVTHALAMDFIGRARRAEHLAQLDSCGGLGVKLLRTFTAQAEALAKLRRGGEQTVRVEDVHVHAEAFWLAGRVRRTRCQEDGEARRLGTEPTVSFQHRTYRAALHQMDPQAEAAERSEETRAEGAQPSEATNKRRRLLIPSGGEDSWPKPKEH